MAAMRTITDAGCDIHTVENSEAEMPIDETLIGFYMEYLIANYTNDVIYAIDSCGSKIGIPNTARPSTAPAPYVEITFRQVNGQRVRVRHNGQLRINGAVRRVRVKIPFDTLLDGPVFIPELSLVISLGAHANVVLNPASSAYREALVRELQEELADEMVRNPITLAANDPTGRHSHLYTVINDEIVSVRVKHLQYEASDSIVLIRRDRAASADTAKEVRIQRTSFAALERMVDHVWEIDGYWISPHREILEARLQQSRVVDPNRISVSDHKAHMAEQEERHSAVVNLFKEQETTYKREISMLKRQLEQATDAKYADQAANLQQAEFDMQRLKLEHEAEMLARKRHEDATKAKLEETQARLRIQEERLKFAAAAVKALVILIPSSVALWKLLAAYRNA